MKELFSLGELYPSDFLKEGEQPSTEKVELKLIMTDDGLVRLEKTAPANKMYGKYWYRSGINNTMKEALKDVVDSILKIQTLKENDIWLDIASNDGTLLSFVPEKCIRIGCDPAEDSYKIECEKHSDNIIQDFFSAEKCREVFGSLKAKVITSIAMFYDVEEPRKFIKDVYDILDDDGVWVMQLSYSPLMIEQMAFDNICHEHVYYYNLLDLSIILEDGGFRIDDCELNEVNGGSIRLYIRKREKNKEDKLINSKKIRFASLLEFEKNWNYWNELGGYWKWLAWFEEVKELKSQTVSFIKQARSEGKSIWAYGASTKGNTLLQYFGLDNTLIDGIADRNPAKHGLRTIGSNIKIYSEEAMRITQPDYLLILPWHFIKEFTEREKEYLEKGGKFIVPCPEFKIIDKKS